MLYKQDNSVAKLLHKCPIIYKNKEYGIRMEIPKYINSPLIKFDIYKIVTKRNIFKKDNLKAEIIYSVYLNKSSYDKSSNNYYIQMFKYAFKLYLDSLEENNNENNQIESLEKWDGVINE